MFFLIFDLEAAFIFAWAVSLKEAGWPAFVEMLIFISVLLAGLFYLWHEGALDWGAAGRRTTPAQRAAGRSAGRSGDDSQN